MKKWLAVAVLFVLPVFAQQQTAVAASQPATPSSVIAGVVKSGAMPLPGVTITISDAAGHKIITSTEADGTFSAAVPSAGRWTVRAEMAAFSTAAKETVLEGQAGAQVELQLTLASRTATPQARPRSTVAANRGQVFQRLDVTEQANLGTTDLANAASDSPLPGMQALNVLGDSATESVAINGSTGSTNDFVRNFDELRDRMQAMQIAGGPGGPGGQGGMPGGMMGGPGGMGGGGPMGGPGGGMGGPGGFGGMRGGMRGFNVNKLHGMLAYNMQNPVLNASPYFLPTARGGSQDKPNVNNISGMIGGPLRVPKLFDAGPNTSFVLSFSESRSTTPYTATSIVPTLAQRNGDFSQTLVNGAPITILDPITRQAFDNSQISSINPAAQALLAYIPLPNTTGRYNYLYSTTKDNNSTAVGFRLVHNFGSASQQWGKRSSGKRGRRRRQNINFAFNYMSSDADALSTFPTVSGKTKNEGIRANAGFSFSRGRFNSQLDFSFNQQNTNTTNRFAGITNVAGNAGISGISSNPADWGVPTLSLANLFTLSDITPQQQRNRTFQLGDNMFWNHGKHFLRFGVDARRILARVHSNDNPNGSFSFTGFATSPTGAASSAEYELADFLVSTPAQASFQYSPYTDHFAAIGYDMYVQDSLRLRSNFTLDLGLRYEYTSPYTEADNRLSNILFGSNIVAVQAGTSGVPRALVHPDRNNIAPRVGLAWKPFGKMVFRTGYGITYNNGQYRSVVQNMADQVPFSTTENDKAFYPGELTLQQGIVRSSNSYLVPNTYGIDPNYRLGYAQLWNADVQYEIRPTVVMNVSYLGRKGTALDRLRAPNRDATGALLYSDVQSFKWEESEGSSIYHAGVLRLRKRMAKGMSVGGSYTYSKSIDDLGGLAQDDLNPGAERALSSSDMRHQLQADYMYELPFGTGKRFLDHGGLLAQMFGDWTWTGIMNVHSGSPLNILVANDATSLSGLGRSLRPDRNLSEALLVGDNGFQWFNPAAFTVPAGEYGTVGRNSIIGPGGLSVNMSLGKNFVIRDSMALNLRLNANNVFNRKNYTSVNTLYSAGSTVFGQVTGLSSPRAITIDARFRF